VVANTPIRYENNQLLQLIHGHLVLSGLNKTAEMLKNESGIVPLADCGYSSDPPVIQVMDDNHKVSLGSIVSEYLCSQHALCRSPMITIPKFDLLHPHKCPGHRSSRAAAPNFTARYSKKGLLPPCGGREGSKLDRKLLYSRLRPVQCLEAESDSDSDSDSCAVTSCAFSGDDKFLFIGTDEGNVKMWNLQTNDEITHQLHKNRSGVNHILSSKDSNLLITSSTSKYSKIWSVGDNFVMKQRFKETQHLEFSHLVQDKVVATQSFGVATVYDLHTGQLSRTLIPTCRNRNYSNNRASWASFDPTDSLIISDGVLWDFRAPRQLHCFNNRNKIQADVFHPNGLEIISNADVWDIRTFHLLRTVPQLDQCLSVFNSGGEVIFVKKRFSTGFQTLDSSDHNVIATFDTENFVSGLSSSWNDSYLAVNEEDTVRLYDVGRLTTDPEDQDGAEEDSSHT